jgi:hypothetical protein
MTFIEGEFFQDERKKLIVSERVFVNFIGTDS